MDASAPRTRKRPHLTTFRDVRREMGRVYRDVRAGRLEPQAGTRLVFILQAIARTLELEQTAMEGQKLVCRANGAPPSMTATQALLERLIVDANSTIAPADHA